jgi:hypothetical protein
MDRSARWDAGPTPAQTKPAEQLWSKVKTIDRWSKPTPPTMIWE